ncbi:tRNA threonylcarbamoyladenosine dehydratase [Tepidibacter formicigenes]|jgi:tRNA A37 threonylcarbamoyladenosine dehydratase|uniref:tRNA A37 threonylcarbamoyladenosine dehydratase n=1 Tax=Tepidibacter formicigenes DSM 15518 TaxID=1123349 RepID=A0A1M6LJS9_9FIRM|nr:tRNA threonylcarbamoyladenosine dehydratase [Tepidibacter formicigenes]SHJ71398.1 tRNA A37 threonylcarbamoyladenosine dehydratase [Tepidibacter formicigenes DSM 15518]
MLHEFSRTEMLIGTEELNKLKKSTVAVFGVGGVGTFAIEGLVRSGVGRFILVDDDDVCLTNINRQIHATRKTVGKAKVEVMKERMLEINPKVEVKIFKELYNKESAQRLLSDEYDYVIDAIDMVSAKLDLIERCTKKNTPIISCMGAGNKLSPTRLEVTDVYKTSMCPLAKVMRSELRKRGIKKLKVVYSKEKPITPKAVGGDCKTNCICSNKDRTCVERRQIPGSVSFVPSVAGLIIASEVVKDIIGYTEN